MLLIPDKFMKFENCVLKVSADILDILRNQPRKIMKFDNLYEFFYEKFKDDTEYIFFPALNFLFLLGKIEYEKEKDRVKFIK